MNVWSDGERRASAPVLLLPLFPPSFFKSTCSVLRLTTSPPSMHYTPLSFCCCGFSRGFRVPFKDTIPVIFDSKDGT